MFRYHPLMFGLITACAIVDLGLTAYEHHQRKHLPLGGHPVTSRLDYLIFLSAWTTLFGAAYLIFAHTGRFGRIASFASHAFWLFITFIMWVVAAALWQREMIRVGCGSTSFQCNINHTIEGFSWLLMALTLITLLLIILHIGGKRERYRTGPYDP